MFPELSTGSFFSCRVACLERRRRLAVAGISTATSNWRRDGSFRLIVPGMVHFWIAESSWSGESSKSNLAAKGLRDMKSGRVRPYRDFVRELRSSHEL